MTLTETIRSYIILLAANKLENKLDGRLLTRNLDKQLDDFLGQKNSEKLQEGALTNYFLEAVEGLYEDRPAELLPRITQWIVDIKTRTGTWKTPKNETAKSNISPKKRT